MPTYKVTAPDGRTVRLTGDSPPSEAELEQVFASLPAAESASEESGERFSGWESAGRGALEGVTLGAVDEIYGGVSSLFGDETYEEARDRFREEQAAAREEDPWAFGLAEAASGFVLPGFGAAKAAGTAAKALPRALRAGGVGAGYGAAAGAGYSEGENVGQVTGDVLRGAAVGGALGVGVERAARGLQRARHRYSKQGVEGRLTRGLLEEDGLTPEDAAAMMRRDPDLRLGDLTSRGRAELAEMAREGEVFNELNERGTRLGTRFMNERLNEVTDADVRLAGKQIEDTLKKMKAPEFTTTQQQMNRLLGYLDEEGNIVPGAMTDRLLAVDSGIFAKAEKAATARYGRPKRQTDVQRMRYIAGINEVLSAKASQATKPSGQRAAAVRGDFLDEVRKLNPEYADALDNYGRQIDLSKASKRISKEVRDGNLSRFFDKIERADTESQVASDVNKLLPEGVRDIPELLDAAKMIRMMAQTRDKLPRPGEAPSSVFNDVDRKLTQLKQDFIDLTRAASAGRFGPGSTQLAVGSAYQRLVRTMASLVPGLGPATVGNTGTGPLRNALMGRSVPAYRPATQRPLSRAAATLTGGLAVNQGD